MRQRIPNVSVKIHEFLMAHPGSEYSIESIVSNTGLPRSSVSSTMARLLKRGVVQKGSVHGMWRHAVNGEEPTKPLVAGDILEVLRCREGGDIVLIDANGNFYVGRRVDV